MKIGTRVRTTVNNGGDCPKGTEGTIVGYWVDSDDWNGVIKKDVSFPYTFKGDNGGVTHLMAEDEIEAINDEVK